MWDSDKIDVITQKAAGEVQLRNYGKCLEEYAVKLQRIEERLDCCVNNCWDLSLDPVAFNSSPVEHCSLVHLIDTDNKILNKILIALAATCAEIEFLQHEAHTKFYSAILFYGEGNETNAAICISQMLPTLQTICSFIGRCEALLTVAIKQLSSLHGGSKMNAAPVPALDVHFQLVIEHIGDLLVILVTLDELLQSQTVLREHWASFKRSLGTLSMDVESYSGHARRFQSLDSAVSELEHTVFSRSLLRHGLEQLLDPHTGVQPGPGLAEQLARYIRTCASDLDSEVDPQLPWVRLSVLFVLNSIVCANTDKKLFKLVWEPYKKIQAVTLIGNIMWQPEDFFLKHLPHLGQIVDKKVKAAITSSRLSYLQQKSQALPRDTQFYYFQVCSWLVQMDTCMKQDSTHLKLEHLQMRCALLLQGLDYAVGLKRLITTVTNLHVSLAQPMTKTSVVALCRLVELLKYIQFMFHGHSVAVAESVNHVIQHLTYQAIGIVVAAKRNITGDTKYSAAQLDVLSSLLLAERALHGPGTRDRRLVTHLALSTANQMKTFRDEDILNLKHILRKLDMICDLQSQLKNACNCSFLYWHRVIIPIYLAHLYESHTELHCVKYICAAVNDSLGAIQHTKLNGAQQNLKKSLQKEMIGAFESQVLKPLCHQIETDLRLHVHSHLQLNDRNPLLNATHNCAPLLKTQPLPFFGQFISIKAYVENYLNQTFYNLTTVALHDWKTYGEMRCLAKQKYELNTVEDDLPSQTLEQGLDVLEILRNIHVFVSKYLYNLNNQIFIESSSNNKHLNTINIRHIANSIRTHGTGIMNTTVNFTYQFLKKKLYILSQFLYDEQIKSRLMRDLKYFRETKALNDQKFPFDRAEKLNRGIRKLGLSQEKLTYLDRFRILISHIGNAMGYVRMIRTGGLHCSSNAICFIPDLEDIVSFQELSQEQGFTQASLEAAKALDHVLETLAKNFDENTEYFKLLVDVFAPVCRDPRNAHLQNFHIIVPSLTINFVEHSITAKDKMTKKNKNGAAFTDDGFAMGVAYILKMLDLNSDFDSLHWFQSVSEKYKKEKANLLEQQANISKEDEKLQQTMTLTARRLDLYQQEYELLYYSLSSARIFFQKHSPASQGERTHAS